jgi:hypothetical protein
VGFSTTPLYPCKDKIPRAGTKFSSYAGSGDIEQKWANYRTFLQIFQSAEVDNFVDNMCKSLLIVGRVTFKWVDG